MNENESEWVKNRLGDVVNTPPPKKLGGMAGYFAEIWNPRCSNELNFTIESLKVVDDLIDEIKKNVKDPNEQNRPLISCYVGEVLVHNIPELRWVADERSFQEVLEKMKGLVDQDDSASRYLLFHHLRGPKDTLISVLFLVERTIYIFTLGLYLNAWRSKVKKSW